MSSPRVCVCVCDCALWICQTGSSGENRATLLDRVDSQESGEDGLSQSWSRVNSVSLLSLSLSLSFSLFFCQSHHLSFSISSAQTDYLHNRHPLMTSVFNLLPFPFLTTFQSFLWNIFLFFPTPVYASSPASTSLASTFLASTKSLPPFLAINTQTMSSAFCIMYLHGFA